ncbi:unnamed protein product [Oppiella nova]|uniref:Uncharacterized protein n=1 Tax=Oppiella nova TaxID=334625 RepID=A0A7R9MFS5_9ACAR|nr:unnamed protein product [Oppiella nova]CAG2176264.1 unnamed protein product [Oppiella nova]
MGNIHSDVTAGVKKQAVSNKKIYSLVDVKKGGILVDIMRNAIRTGDFTRVDNEIQEIVRPFLYNGGEGKKVSICQLIRLRNKDAFGNKLILNSNDQEIDEDYEDNDNKTILVSTPIHVELARHIYLDDEYYGEGALHMAVVNEDLSMVKYLLNNGADVRARAIGKFFCVDDQKESREGVLEHEWYQMKTETNYMGFAYHLFLSYKQSIN